MANRMFSDTISKLKLATDRALGMIDSDGVVIADSVQSAIGSKQTELARLLALSPDRLIVHAGYTAVKLGTAEESFDYAVFIEGEDETARALCQMAEVALNSAKCYYEEKHDMGNFIKNIMTDNILPGDIYIRAKELHFPTDQTRAVFLVRQASADAATVDALQAMFPDRQQDFVISINETDLVVVKRVSEQTETDELIELAQSIEDTLKSQLFVKTTIGIGTTAQHLRGLADSYKEAQVAIEVGKVFDADKAIISYENLGIGRLIYQLPTTLCEIFLSEVFKKNSIDSLDQETLFTINKFFENNLNVSETSRKLFVHRNTLVYRLEKIKKLTGLDLREFDHAIIFKVALMVKKYLSSRENRMF